MRLLLGVLGELCERLLFPGGTWLILLTVPCLEATRGATRARSRYLSPRRKVRQGKQRNAFASWRTWRALREIAFPWGDLADIVSGPVPRSDSGSYPCPQPISLAKAQSTPREAKKCVCFLAYLASFARDCFSLGGLG